MSSRGSKGKNAPASQIPTRSPLLAYSPRYDSLTEWVNTGGGPDVPVYTLSQSSFRHLGEFYASVAASPVRLISRMVKVVPAVPFEPTPAVIDAVSDLVIKDASEESYSELRAGSGVYETTRCTPTAEGVTFPMTVSDYFHHAKSFQSRMLPVSKKPPEWEQHLYGSLGSAVSPYTFYGASNEGGVVLPHLDLNRVTILNYLQGEVPGLNSTWFYAGMARTTTELHSEDLELPSVNVSIMGEPKMWTCVAAEDSARVVAELRLEFPALFADCAEAFEHRHWLLTPEWFQRHNIKYSTCLQYPGEAILLFPGALHQVMNTGFCLAQARNLADRQWVREVYGPVIAEDHYRQCECSILNNAGRPPKVTRFLLREEYLQALLNYDMQVYVKSQLSQLLGLLPTLNVPSTSQAPLALEPVRSASFRSSASAFVEIPPSAPPTSSILRPTPQGSTQLTGAGGSSLQVTSVEAALAKVVAKRDVARIFHADVFPFYIDSASSSAGRQASLPRPAEAASSRRYSCLICKRSYIHAVSLYRHRATAHGLAEKHVCTQCGQKFSLSSTLRAHAERCGR